MISLLNCNIEVLENFPNKLDAHLASVWLDLWNQSWPFFTAWGKWESCCMYVVHTLLSLILIFSQDFCQFILTFTTLNSCYTQEENGLMLKFRFDSSIITKRLQPSLKRASNQLLFSCQITTCLILESKVFWDHVPNEHQPTTSSN